MAKNLLTVLTAALAVLAFNGAGISYAQSSPTSSPTPTPAALTNVFQDSYYANAGDSAFPDGTVRIVNSSGASLCALIYVIDADQEMKECCGCPISENGTEILSVNNDLTSNPFNGVATVNGSISIISSAAKACDPRAPEPTPELAAFGTHLQDSGALTAGDFNAHPLPDATLSSLTADCRAIGLVGSGKGICSCVAELATPTPSPSATPTATATSSSTPMPTATPTATPTSTPTIIATATPTATPTAAATGAPVVVLPTATPTVTPTATPTPTSVLTVSPARLNFGKIDATASSKSKKLTFRNKGAASAVIGQLIPPASFIISADTCSNTTMAPKGKCTVEVAFAPATVVGSVNEALQIPYNGSSPAATLEGNGIAAKLSAPGAKTLRGTDVGVFGTPSAITITNRSTATVKLGSASAVPDFLIPADGCASATLAPRAHCAVTVEFVPRNGASGEVTDALIYNFTYGANSGSVSIVLKGRVK